MIIVTGPDNTGKTSLVKHLVKEFDLKQVPRYHTLPPTDYDDWQKWLLEQWNNPDELHMIVDRMYVDEFVYGPVVRGYIGLTDSQVVALDKKLIQLQPLIIHCNTSIENMMKGFSDRKQYPTIEQNKLVKQRFEKILAMYPFMFCPQYEFDYEEDGDYREVTRRVDRYLMKGGEKNECQ